MRVAISVVTPPVSDAVQVSLAEAKAHLRVDHDEEDDYIRRLIPGAAYRVEGFTGQLLMQQTVDCFFSAVPTSRVLSLPVAPVSEVDEVALNGTVVADTSYATTLFDGETRYPSQVVFATAPTLTVAGFPVRVRCEVGHELKPAEMDTSMTVYYGRARTAGTAPTEAEFTALSSYDTTTRVSGRLQWGADPAGSGTITNFILIEDGGDELTEVLSYSTDPPTSIFANFTAQSDWTHPTTTVVYQVWTATDGIDATTEYVIENDPERVAQVPEGIKQAILTIVAGMYVGRQDIVQGGPPGTYANMMLSERLMEPYVLQWAF